MFNFIPFASTQSITILEVDLEDEDVRVNLDHVESGFLRTSVSGRRIGATAAVNGSFFDTKVVERPETGWESLTGFPDLLASGPLLVKKDELVEQVEQPFNTNRHPRTAIGLTDDGRLLAVVVDGRNAEAHGMSIKELVQLMQALGCVEAMNLDGGGSSTAWVKSYGVVNYPGDNKIFDHKGEREVVTVINFIIQEPKRQYLMNLL